MDIDAPREGRATTRVNWLIRQLANAPDGTRIEAFVAHSRGSSAAELLATVRENPALLVNDSSKELRSFRIAFSAPMGPKRGRGRGSFIDSVLASVDTFYSDVLQNLKAWSASPPKLRHPDAELVAAQEQPTPTQLVSTGYSSQDQPMYAGAEATGDDPPQRNLGLCA